MKDTLLLAGIAFALAAAPSILRSDEARASVYVVDRSGEFAATDGACLPFHSMEKPGPSREILAIARGPAGSMVFMIAFAGDAPHLGLPPVLAAQGEESKPVRFPAEGAKWPFESAAKPVDLYLAVFDQADPELAKLTEYSGWLTDALKSRNETEILLHSEAIKKRLSHLLRQQGGSELSGKLGGAITAPREASSTKAATTRGGVGSTGFPGKRDLKASLAAVRRGLKTLDTEWKEDSRPIAFGLAKPGVLVIPIATTTAP
jgi:hypothetical protein